MATLPFGGTVLFRVKRLLGRSVRWPRLTMRGAIILIAVVAVLMSIGDSVKRRSLRYHQMYELHYKRARWLWNDAIYGGHDLSRRERSFREAKEEDALAEEYRRASHRLW